MKTFSSKTILRKDGKHIKQIGSVTYLTKLITFINFKLKGLTVNAFLKAKFNYCPLIQTFHGRKDNKTIPPQGLNQMSTFDELLEKIIVSIH